MTTPSPRNRLRIAIQKSGRLSDHSRKLLTACGLAWSEHRDGLFFVGEGLPVDLLLVRDDDIPGLIASGVCDFGIVGRNVLAEEEKRLTFTGRTPAFTEVAALGFGGCNLSLAIPDDWRWKGPETVQGMRIATSYPNLTRAWVEANELEADIVTLSGSVEIAPKLGQADVVVDLVSSGATLAANQLKPVTDVLISEAVLAGPASQLSGERGRLADMLLRRLRGALKQRQSRLLMFQAAREHIDTLIALLPESDPPTTLVAGDGGLALQVVCHGDVSWQKLEELKLAGAHGLLVLPVERMLA